MGSAAAPLECVATLRGHIERRVWHVAWSPTGRTLASCAADRAIRLWASSRADGGEWSCLAILEDGHQRTVRRIAWAPCGTLLASASFDATAMIWKCEDGVFDCLASLEGHDNEVKAVAWSPSGAYVATCGRDKSVWVWEAEDEAYEVAAVLHSHTQDVKDVVWHPTTDVLASCSYDDTVKIITQDGDDWRCHATLSGHSSTVWGVAFSEDGKSLVSCSDDRSVVLWRDEGGNFNFQRASSITDVHERAIYSISWEKRSRDQGQIVTGGGDDAICVFSVCPSSELHGDVGAAAAAAKSSHNDGPVGIRFEGRVASAHKGDVNTVAWSCDAKGNSSGALLASAGDDGAIRIWRAVK